VLGLVLFGATFLLAVFPAGAASPVSPTVTTDNFTTDTGDWTYAGVTTRGNGVVTLLDNTTNSFGQLWFKRDIGSPFTVSFEAYGVGLGQDVVVMFYKDRDFTPSSTNGFQSDSGLSPGYGVEFDYYPYDPYGINPGNWWQSYVALISDNTEDNIAYNISNASPTSFGWVNVVIAVNETHVSVYVNNTRWLDVNYAFNPQYSGFGFCGGCNWRAMQFQITNVTLTENNSPSVQPVSINFTAVMMIAGVVIVGARATASAVQGRTKPKTPSRDA
jgi:hypothetical protein